MTTITDTAADASIGASTRELRLPVVRTEAVRLAEAALRDRVSHLTLSMSSSTSVAPSCCPDSHRARGEGISGHRVELAVL
jgi:hypothetical protein